MTDQAKAIPCSWTLPFYDEAGERRPIEDAALLIVDADGTFPFLVRSMGTTDMADRGHKAQIEELEAEVARLRLLKGGKDE